MLSVQNSQISPLISQRKYTARSHTQTEGQSNRRDKTLKKKKVQRTEKVDDKEKLQLDTVCFNTTI